MEKSNATKYDIAVVVADLLFKTGRYEKAIDFYKEAQILLKNVKDLSVFKMKSCVLHLRLARAFYITRSLKEALTNYEHALKVSEAIDDIKRKITACQGIRDVYSSRGQFVHVIFYERKLLQIAKETGKKQLELTAHSNIGEAYYRLNKRTKSIQSHGEALKVSQEIGDRKGESNALFFLGSVYKQLAQYDKAISNLEKALRIRNEIGDFRGEASTYQELGNTYHEYGVFDKALNCHNKSLKMMTTLQDLFEQGVCYNNIATTYAVIGRIDEAVELFLKSLNIMTKLRIKGAQGRAHFGLGNCYSELGQYKDSLKHYEMGLEFLEEIGDKFGVGRSCASLCAVYNWIGQYYQAITFSKRALKVSKEIGDKKVESNAYQGLGEAYFALDRHSGRGEKNVKKALEIAKQTGDKHQMALDLTTLAAMNLRKGQYKESLENQQSAMKIIKEIGDRTREVSSLSCLASIYIALRKFAEGKKHLQEALRILRETGEKGQEYSVLYSLGVCSSKNLEFEKAREYLFESILCVERDRQLLGDECKLALDNLTFQNYKELSTLLIALGNIPEALCTAERGRARALVDLLSKNYGVKDRLCSDEPIHMTEIERTSIQSQSTIIFMADVHEDLFSWVINQGKISFRLSKCKSREESVTNLFNLPRDQLLRALLGSSGGECEDRSLAEYYKVHSSAIKKQCKVKGQHPQNKEHNQNVKKTEAKESALHLLYRRMFAPVSDHVQSQDIIIVPEGDMWMVPFPALKDADGKFLSETYRIRVIPSLTVLKLIQTSPVDYHKTTGALIVGDPDVHPKTRLPPLPGAKKEAQEIADLLGVTAIVGRQATKEEVLRRIQEVSLIHIAAHGDAERGEIALSPNRSAPRVPRKEDFMLTMEDVVKVGVRAKLVVLSCCHSGRGEILKSEGVVGIARAFLASGARSVLVSLWVLDDKSTKEFMIRFYKCLVCDKLTTSQAVHQTMKWMRESTDYSSMGDWAPFVLIGDDIELNL